MARTVHRVDDADNPGGPMLGALLRRPFFDMRAHIQRALHVAGFTDLQVSHLAVLQHPGPHGRTPTEIARAALMSKQAINNLLGHLENAGYVRRVAHPDNRRERRVELTTSGQRAIRVIRNAVTERERDWQTHLGADRYAQLRTLLADLNSTLDETPPPG